MGLDPYCLTGDTSGVAGFSFRTGLSSESLILNRTSIIVWLIMSFLSEVSPVVNEKKLITDMCFHNYKCHTEDVN